MSTNKNKINHPYKVPDAYFNTLATKINKRIKDEQEVTKPEIIKNSNQKANSKVHRFNNISKYSLRIAASISILALLTISILYWQLRPQENGNVKFAPLNTQKIDGITSFDTENELALINENTDSLYDDLLNESTLEKLQEYVDNVSLSDTNEYAQDDFPYDSYSFYDI